MRPEQALEEKLLVKTLMRRARYVDAYDVLKQSDGEYTLEELAERLDAVVSGLKHAAAVQGISDDPPDAPQPGEFWIVGGNPTGGWAGHAGRVAMWNGDEWEFSDADAGEARLVQDEEAIFSFNGDEWVQVQSKPQPEAVVGEIRQFWLPEPPNPRWLECTGGEYNANRFPELHRALGSPDAHLLPDLSNRFLRVAGEYAVGDTGLDTTRMPRNGFTVEQAGSHTHATESNAFSDGSSASDWTVWGKLPAAPKEGRGTNWYANGSAVKANGNHSHDITGGDGETAPRWAAVLTCIYAGFPKE